MRLSIFTPVHPPTLPHLQAAYASLLEQEPPGLDWEWVLVPNGGAEIPSAIAADPRVRVRPFEAAQIGALKAHACRHCRGDVLVELDGDDLLAPDCLAALGDVFGGDRQVQAAYSNTVEFRDGTWAPVTYGAAYGWQTRPCAWPREGMVESLAWPPESLPHSLRRIYWAPNHVRAFRASAYRAVGGHDATLAVMDDHDLLCRLYVAYGARGFAHLDRPLYAQRHHAGSTCAVRNAELQAAAAASYRRHVFGLACRWADDCGLRKLDLGGAIDGQPGFEAVDRLQGADICADLDQAWPFADGTVGVLRASHVLEHLRDPVHAMTEAWRVLAPGGWLFVEVPSTDGRGAWQDPTHVSFWNEHSFWYWTRRTHARYVQAAGKAAVGEQAVDCRSGTVPSTAHSLQPTASQPAAFPVRFQESLLVTEDLAPHIPVVRAHLIKLAPPYDQRPAGEVLI